MSRSNPSERTPNPCSRWFEWRGEKGDVSYWDKETKARVPVALPWSFLLLDEVASVKGWHDAAQNFLYSNEVRDTSTDVLVVKVHKGETVAEGKYRDIKDMVRAAGGRFNASLYLAYFDGTDYRLGNIGFKGAALKSWMDFRQKVGHARYSKAISITDFTEGRKGRVVYRMPVFALKDISHDAETRAQDLDAELQKFLTANMARTKRDQADAPHDDEPPIDDSADAIDAGSIPF